MRVLDKIMQMFLYGCAIVLAIGGAYEMSMLATILANLMGVENKLYDLEVTENSRYGIWLLYQMKENEKEEKEKK